MNVISRFTGELVDEVCVVVDCPFETISEEIEGAGEKAGIPVHVIENPRRRGIGYSIREGIDYALKRGFDVVVVLACNNKGIQERFPAS